MATKLPRITFKNKKDYRNENVQEEYRISAVDMNSIKDTFNQSATAIENSIALTELAQENLGDYKVENGTLYLKRADGTWNTSGVLLAGQTTLCDNLGNAILNGRISAQNNLLINSDFRNPVNQRGKENYYTNGGNAYTIDRWRANGLVVTVNSNTITIANNNATPKPFIQPIEYSLYTDYYTATINVLDLSGQTHIRYYDVDKNLHDEQEELKLGENTKTINDSISVFGLLLDANSRVELEYIKLEPGQIATKFLQEDNDLTIKKCERFYNNKSTIAFGIVSGSSFFGLIPMSTQMRDTVVTNIKDTTFTVNCNGVTYTPTITSVIAAVPRYGGMWIGLRFTNATIPNKTMCMIENLYIEFDGDIY